MTTTHFQTIDGKGFNHNNTAPKPISDVPFLRHNILGTFSAVDLAAELGINPKSFRRKLRKLTDKLPSTVCDKGWIFNSSDKDALIKLFA
jgi:hypothetical protein